MRLAAAVLLSFLLPACNAEGKAAQQPPPPISITDLSNTSIPPFKGRLIVGSGPLDIYGLVPRGGHDTDSSLVVVELLTSQTAAAMHLGGTKIDALSTVFDIDCLTMRYRRSNQVNYAKDGQPLYRLNNGNDMIDLPPASPLAIACDRDIPGMELGEHFSSMPEFLSAADAILEPRRANLPPVIITATPPKRPN